MTYAIKTSNHIVIFIAHAIRCAKVSGTFRVHILMQRLKSQMQEIMKLNRGTCIIKSQVMMVYETEKLERQIET